MSGEYKDCKLAMTPGCPSRNHDSMLDLLARAGSSVKRKVITDEIIDSASSLCEECVEFTPRGIDT